MKANIATPTPTFILVNRNKNGSQKVGCVLVSWSETFVLRCEVYHLRWDGVSHPGGKLGLKEGKMKLTFTQDLKVPLVSTLHSHFTDLLLGDHWKESKGNLEVNKLGCCLAPYPTTLPGTLLAGICGPRCVWCVAWVSTAYLSDGFGFLNQGEDIPWLLVMLLWSFNLDLFVRPLLLNSKWSLPKWSKLVCIHSGLNFEFC